VASTTQPVAIGSPLNASYSVSPSAPVVATATTFDGRGSTDPNPSPGGSITAYAWSFGDGSSGAGATAQHTYARAGMYTVTLTIADAIGLIGTVTHVINVGPAAHFKVTTKHPGTGQHVQFDGSSSSDPGGRIVQYHWNFGDGSTGSGIKPTHVFHHAGNFTVTITVTDVGGVQGSFSMKVRIPKSGAITSVSTKNGFLVIKFSGPGVLTLGSGHFRVHHAGTLKIKPPLTGGQLAKLRSTHVLKLTLKIKFVPTAGPPQTGTLRITLHG
jgi:chitodextrinase